MSPVKLVVGAIVLSLGVLAIVTLVLGMEVPKGAVQTNIYVLPCAPAYLILYDTNGNEADGSEFVTLMVPGEERPRAILEFGSGASGEFKQAVVTIPGEAPVYFTTAAALGKAYPDPCAIALKPVPQRT